MNYRICIIFALLIAFTSEAQELNEDFLNSLPDDIKKDLEEKNTNQGSNSKENYKPYLYSSLIK